MHFIPGLRMRSSEEAEIVGIDEFDMGEFAYDYVGLEQELGHDIEGKAGQSTVGGREPNHHQVHESDTSVVEEKTHS